jgi:hypothetical protein
VRFEEEKSRKEVWIGGCGTGRRKKVAAMGISI